jgi:hypothetical protein
MPLTARSLGSWLLAGVAVRQWYATCEAWEGKQAVRTGIRAANIVVTAHREVAAIEMQSSSCRGARDAVRVLGDHGQRTEPTGTGMSDGAAWAALAVFGAVCERHFYGTVHISQRCTIAAERTEASVMPGSRGKRERLEQMRSKCGIDACFCTWLWQSVHDRATASCSSCTITCISQALRRHGTCIKHCWE